MNPSQNCASPLTAYYALKENTNETGPVNQTDKKVMVVIARLLE